MLDSARILTLSDDFKNVLDLLEKHRTNLFVTGRAGTGKSTLLQLFRSTTRKKAVVLAPTGIAALNIGGQTIHSFFGFAPRLLHSNDIKLVRNRRLYEKLEILIIDEISMVRADMLDNIDMFLKVNRRNNQPFGGVQMVFFGDLFQLPPVVSSDEERQFLKMNYESVYFFAANALKNLTWQVYELQKIYRQEERHFIRLLDAIRQNKADFEDLEDFNERHDAHFQQNDSYITLTTRNDIADRINQAKLRDIEHQPYIFEAHITGNFGGKTFPSEQFLVLKKDAQVMFVKNDLERRYVNGTLGRVVSLQTDTILVAVKDQQGQEKEVEVPIETWENIRYKLSDTQRDQFESEVVGTFAQYPLRLAWAITIHKSQGKTFDKVIIDLGNGAFEHGQTYVALSRCRTLNGIVLRNKLRAQDVQVDEVVADFCKKMLR